MKSFFQNGNILDYVNSSGSDIAGDAVVVIGNRIGVACDLIPNGSTGSVSMSGVFTLPKASGAISEGDALFWDTSALNLTKTPSSNAKVFAGVAFSVQLSGDTNVNILLHDGSVQSASIAAIGSLSTVPGSLGVAAALADLTTVQVKVDALIAALKAAGLMAT